MRVQMKTPSQKKRQRKKSGLSTVLRSAPAISKISAPYRRWVLVSLLTVISSGWCIDHDRYGTGVVLFLSAIALIGRLPVETRTGTRWGSFCTVIGLALLGWGVLTAPGLSQNLAPGPAWSGPHHAPYYLVLGLFLSFWGFKALPQKPQSDLSPWLARILFLAILGVSIKMRFSHLQDPYPLYWDDMAVSALDSKNIVDLKEYHMLFALGDRQPFYQYFMALIYVIFPNQTSIWVQNFTWSTLDIFGVWLSYLVGKEYSGRWAGLALMAWVAASKPDLIACFSDFPGVMVVPFTALAILLTLRMFNKPNRSHFIQWGAGVAFGAYCYTATRPYLWALVIIGLVWSRLDPKERMSGRAGRVLVYVTGTYWTYLFFWRNNYIPDGSLLSIGANPILLIIVSLFILWNFFELQGRLATGVPGKRIVGVTVGIFFAVILMLPIISINGYAEHASHLSIFKDIHGGKTEAFHTIREQLWNTLRTLFWSGQDRADLSLGNEAFWGYHSVPWILWGWTAFLARPKWNGWWILFCGLVALSPHVLSVDPQSAKLLGIVIPSLLFGAAALHMVLDNLWRFRLGKVLAAILLTATVSVWMLQARVMDYRFFTKLASSRTNDGLVHMSLRKDAPHYWCFLHPSGEFFSFPSQCVLEDGFGWDIYALMDGCGEIGLDETEPPPDVAVYVSPVQKKAIDRLRLEYPTARWELTRQAFQNPNGPPAFYRVYIPAASLPVVAPDVPERKWIYIRRYPVGTWRRQVFAHRMGMNRGIIVWEDHVQDPAAPFNPSVATAQHTLRLDKVWTAPVNGKYDFQSTTANYLDLEIDGKRFISIRPRSSVKVEGSIELMAGEHHVTLRTLYQYGLITPPVQAVYPGDKEPRDFGQW